MVLVSIVAEKTHSTRKQVAHAAVLRLILTFTIAPAFPSLHSFRYTAGKPPIVLSAREVRPKKVKPHLKTFYSFIPSLG